MLRPGWTCDVWEFLTLRPITLEWFPFPFQKKTKTTTAIKFESAMLSPKIWLNEEIFSFFRAVGAMNYCVKVCTNFTHWWRNSPPCTHNEDFIATKVWQSRLSGHEQESDKLIATLFVIICTCLERANPKSFLILSTWTEQIKQKHCYLVTNSIANTNYFALIDSTVVAFHTFIFCTLKCWWKNISEVQPTIGSITSSFPSH